MTVTDRDLVRVTVGLELTVIDTLACLDVARGVTDLEYVGDMLYVIDGLGVNVYGFVVAIGVIDRVRVTDTERVTDLVTDKLKGLVVAIGESVTV